MKIERDRVKEEKRDKANEINRKREIERKIQRGKR